MHIHEFELRYQAFTGLSKNLRLSWDTDTCIQLVQITNRGILHKQIQELTPIELKHITQETYTQYKQDFLTHPDNQQKIEDFSIAEYIERLEYELKVIKEMGFNSYFLIVSDFVKRAKTNSIVVGPGRGSGAGSLLAWVTDITDVNPLPYGLLFERFLNPARISMPDFDIDFEDTLREKVIEYVTDKYGNENVCAIGTYMKMATKAAFKDTARATGIPFDISNTVSRLIPDKMDILQALESPDTPEEFKQMYQTDEKIKNAINLSAELAGNMRQLGVHACGIIISPDPVWTYTPVQYIHSSHDTLVSQYDGPSLESIGLLKMDFLGLRNLSVIKNCIKIIAKKAENEGTYLPDMMKYFLQTMSFQPPLDDTLTFEKVFQVGDTTGIFQFEGDGIRRFLMKLKADSINDLVAMNALYRPGPLEFIPNYIARKHGEEAISYMSDELKDILTKSHSADIAEQEEKKLIEDLSPIMNITYGIAVYQEQLMFLVQSMAGFSLAEADNLRRGVGKKKKEVIEQIKKEFIERGAQHRNYKPETCIYIYEKMIEPAANYSFNKSHSVCYALIAYQTAYLKAHYTTEFYAALIRSVEEDTDTLSTYISEAQTHSITVLQPDINHSFAHVAAIKKDIRLGFFCMKGIGIEVAEYIQHERKKSGLYKDLEDFLTRCKTVINKKSLESLIKGGALDAFEDRKTLAYNIETLLQWTKSSQSMEQGLFGMDTTHSKIQFKETFQSSPMEKLMMEQEIFKSFVSSHPFDGLYPYMKNFGFISQFQGEEAQGPFEFIGIITNIQRAKKKGFFMQLEDVSGTIEFFMKDVLDLKKFDIVIVSGYKGSRSPSLDKLIKISHDELIKRATSANKHDPQYTYSYVKQLRGPKTESTPADLHLPDSVENPIKSEDISKHITQEIAISSEPIDPIFDIPENMIQMQQLIHLIKTHPGSQTIYIGNNKHTVDPSIIDTIHILTSPTPTPV